MTLPYSYDQEDILLELDGSNQIVARYTHGPGIDEPLILEKAGASFFYHADGLASITEITDSAGVIKQQYAYASFGKIESQLDANFIQPYTFTAREFDPETGLYYYRARYYDSSTGRFLSEDPVLRVGSPRVPYLLPILLRDPLNLHMYSYGRNNPERFVDPRGELIGEAAVVVAGGIIAYSAYSLRNKFREWADRGIELNAERNRALSENRYADYCRLDPLVKEAGINTGKAGIELGLTLPGTSAIGPVPTSRLEVILGAISDLIMGSQITPTPNPPK